MRTIHNIIYLLFIGFIFQSCCDKSKSTNEDIVIARVGENEIYLTKIDSLIRKELFQLRLNGLKQIVSNELIHQEALERNLSVELLREIEVMNKTRTPTSLDLLEFQTGNPDKQWNTNQIEYILKGIFYNQRLEEYTRSLFDKHDVSLMLLPPHSSSINTKNLTCFDYNNIDSRNEVILVMDFECSHCKVSFEIFSSLAEKYRKNVTFRLIYLTTNYDLKGKALMAAKKQGLDIQLINQMINFPTRLYDPLFYSDFIENSKGNPYNFNSGIIDQLSLTDLLITRDILFANGIHSTPVFIVNGLIYDHEAMPEYLELLIKHELIKE